MERRHSKNMPLLWLMTDERVGDAALLAAVARLPSGQGGIIFRHYRTAPDARRALFVALARVARRRRLVLILAGTARQAAGWRADGWHGWDDRRAGRPMLHSVGVHDRKQVQAAARADVDLMLLSPLFPTRSHPGGRHLGRVRFAGLAQQASAPVIALGGVRAPRRTMLAGIGAAGWAAIDGLVDRAGHS